MLKNKIRSISSGKKDPALMESARSYIGRKVVSKSGNFVGKVYDVRFSGSVFAGIVVMKKLSKVFIGKEFFSVSRDAVMLSINPVTSLEGKQVFDADGKRMGKVTEIIRKGNSNTLEAVMVKKNLYSSAVKIPKSEISVSKKNIILKKVYR
ncbi:PRC-barrel domain-containing protein [Candidatus Woesearchaeota archaeon]|nr:PRC-barrel domain-containing protein [Candidatus Woesearchaeota archaeon]